MVTSGNSMSSYVLLGDVAIVSVKSTSELERAKAFAVEIVRRHPRLKAVYAKIEVESELRIPKLVLLWGTEVRETWYKENGLYFHVSIGKVYVNPRLQNEHLMVGRESKGNVLDATCGVGFYGLHAAVYGNTNIVIMNDLNPYAVFDSILSLRRNRRRVRARSIHVLNFDATRLVNLLKSIFDVIILDYPQHPERFACLCRLGRRDGRYRLHIYVVENEAKISNRVGTLLHALASEKCRCEVDEVREVIDYAPHKYVYRVSVACTHSR